MRAGWRDLGLVALTLACAVVLVGWNLERFVGAKPKIREKDLSFLPAPVVARLLSLGHANVMAKLRWIDSFAYFEYQLDHLDDRVVGEGGGGFKRLYATLIALDPAFQPFYEHAALNTSGVLGQHGTALGFLMAGIQAQPGNSALWRNAAILLKVHFKWEERLPLLFDAFLAEWEACESTSLGKQMVWDWKRAMAKRRFRGLEQLPYWLDQLRGSEPGTPNGDFIEGTIREQLAVYGAGELDGLADSYREAHGGCPERLVDWWRNLPLIDPLRLNATPAEAEPHRLEDLLDARLLRFRYPTGLPGFGPVIVDQGGRPQLRSDPFGFPWRWQRGHALSTGLARRRSEHDLARLNDRLLASVRDRGRWPETLAEVAAWGIVLPDPPPDGRLKLDGQAVTVEWLVEPGPPWPLR